MERRRVARGLAVVVCVWVGAVSCTETTSQESSRWSFAGSQQRGDDATTGDADRSGDTACDPDRDERCNGIDDDCDGRTDEELTRRCPRQQGVCLGASVACSGGSYPSCEAGDYGPDYTQDEGSDDCDGRDNDCDGKTDESCDCEPGATRPCYPADPATRGVGRCEAGTQRCRSNRRWGVCQGETTPSPERCDGSDDDCDGTTDEGCKCNYEGKSAGVCTDATRDESGACTQPPGFESPTDDEASCSDDDNDCDGVEDEGCPCDYQSTSRGVCVGQTRRPDGTCPRPAEFEQNELSVGDGLDNDCDGRVDERFVARLASGGDFSCALTSMDRVKCWGFRGRGTKNPSQSKLRQVTAGHYHACGVTTAGGVDCWGRSYYVPPKWSGTNFRQVSSFNHTCVVRTSGSVDCWGPSDGAETKPPAGTFRQVSAGQQHTCGVTAAGALECWGEDRFNHGVTNPPSGTFVQVASGQSFACGVTVGGAIKCWGSSRSGRTNAPSGTFRQVSAGRSHACAVENSGTVQCWGSNNWGESNPPSGAFLQVAAGSYHTCGRRPGGDVDCWGRNDAGQSNPPSF